MPFRLVILSLSLASALAIPVASQPRLAVDPEAIDDAVNRVLAARDIPGAVVGVLEGGKLVHQKAYGYKRLDPKTPMALDTVFQIGSVTKSMTATVLADLIEDETVRWDTLVRSLLPESKAPKPIGALTLRQIATHTSGLPRSAPNRRNVPDSPSVALPYSVEDLYAGLAASTLEGKPGDRWSYSNFGYGLLGHLLARAEKKPFETVARTRLFRPLGMTSTGVHPTPAIKKRMADHHWDRDHPRRAQKRWIFGQIAGHGGVYSTVGDLAHYIAFHQGMKPGPLGKESLADLHRPRVPLEKDSPHSMGTGWFIHKLGPVKMCGHGGEVDGHSSFVGWIPGHGIGLIVLANLGSDAAERLSRRIVRTFMRR